MLENDTKHALDIHIVSMVKFLRMKAYDEQMIVKFDNLYIVVKSRIAIEDFVGVGRHA